MNPPAPSLKSSLPSGLAKPEVATPSVGESPQSLTHLPLTTSSSRLRTVHVNATEAAARLIDGEAICVTTDKRKKKVWLMKIDYILPARLLPWKEQVYVIPNQLIGATFCLERMWIFEIRTSAPEHLVQFRFTDRLSRTQGDWATNPSSALSSAHKKVTGEEMDPATNGRGMLGIYTSPVRAIVVACCRAQLAEKYPDLLVHTNEAVALHLDKDESVALMMDPLVTGIPFIPPSTPLDTAASSSSVSSSNVANSLMAMPPNQGTVLPRKKMKEKGEKKTAKAMTDLAKSAAQSNAAQMPASSTSAGVGLLGAAAKKQTVGSPFEESPSDVVQGSIFNSGPGSLGGKGLFSKASSSSAGTGEAEAARALMTLGPSKGMPATKGISVASLPYVRQATFNAYPQAVSNASTIKSGSDGKAKQKETTVAVSAKVATQPSGGRPSNVTTETSAGPRPIETASTSVGTFVPVQMAPALPIAPIAPAAGVVPSATAGMFILAPPMVQSTASSNPVIQPVPPGLIAAPTSGISAPVLVAPPVSAAALSGPNTASAVITPQSPAGMPLENTHDEINMYKSLCAQFQCQIELHKNRQSQIESRVLMMQFDLMRTVLAELRSERFKRYQEQQQRFNPDDELLVHVIRSSAPEITGILKLHYPILTTAIGGSIQPQQQMWQPVNSPENGVNKTGSDPVSAVAAAVAPADDGGNKRPKLSMESE